MSAFEGRSLPDAVVARLENVCEMGQLQVDELDERAFDALKQLNEEGALGVLDQFANSDLSHVQNKSAFLCGIMKTHREKKREEQYGQNNGDGEMKGPNEEMIKILLDRTGYSLDITMGQRKYGGPPPGWEGPPPATGSTGCCQVFVGKIPRDMYEDELIPPFEKYGHIYDFRLMMDPHTGQNKGYGFCTFSDRDSATSACKGLDNTEIRNNRRLGVCISIANDRLFVGSIPKTKSKQDIVDEFRQHTDNLKDAIVYISAEDKFKNRGFAFLEYDTHKAAALARRRLMSGRVKVWGNIVPSVDWADPIEEPDSDTMSKVRVVHVRNVSPNVTEEGIKTQFGEFGEVERVKKLKSYAFVHYVERDSAMRAINEMNGKMFDGLQLEVSLAKPQQSREKRHGQSGFGALNAPGKSPSGRGGPDRGGPPGRGGPRGRGRGRGGDGGYRGGYGGDGGYGGGGYGGGGYGGSYDGYDNYYGGGGGSGGGYDDYYGGRDSYGHSYNDSYDSYDSYGGGDGYDSYGGGYDNSYGGGYGGGSGGGGSGGGGSGGGYGGGGSGGGGSGGGGSGGGGSGGGGSGGRGGGRGSGGYGGGYGGGRGGRGGNPRGGRGRGSGGGSGGQRGGGQGRGGPRGGGGGGGGGGRGRGGSRGGAGGGMQGKRKLDGGGGGGGGNVSYPEPKRRFNQPGSQPIAQQPLEQSNQNYSGYDQNNQWHQDSSYQQWS